MNFLPPLPPQSTLRRRKPVPPDRGAPPTASPPADDEAVQPGWGCGWFDSSHELQQGLEVYEGCSVEALAAELPLDLWLDWYDSRDLAGTCAAG